MFELSAIGIIIGFVSGFFGVGGGMLLVPILLYMHFTIKEAIAISVMQMVFSSLYGSYLNFKKAINLLKDGAVIGVGGFIGGLQSGFIIKNLSDELLKYLLMSILVFSIIRLITAPSQYTQEEKKKANYILLLIIGFFIGLLSMSVGIGGSLILVPILVGFLKYDLKEATTLGLFFVVFSSLAGFISFSYNGQMLFYEGFFVAVASLVGVYFGIKLKNSIQSKSYKYLLLVLNILILISLIYKN